MTASGESVGMSTGRVITALEGIDGAGKSTCSPRIASELADRIGDRAIVRHTGEFASALGPLLHESLSTLTFIEKVYWFAADRASSLAGIAEESPDRRKIVLWDRYTPSAFAYRIAESPHNERQYAYDIVASVNAAFPPPDLVLWLQLPPRDAIARRDGQGSEAFLSEVIGGYEYWISQNAGIEVHTVDASMEIADVVRASVDAIVAHIARKGIM